MCVRVLMHIHGVSPIRKHRVAGVLALIAVGGSSALALAEAAEGYGDNDEYDNSGTVTAPGTDVKYAMSCVLPV